MILRCCDARRDTLLPRGIAVEGVQGRDDYCVLMNARWFPCSLEILPFNGKRLGAETQNVRMWGRAGRATYSTF